MPIGQKLRELRKATNLSQGDIERRTGLIRAYISRVENGHTVPTLMTLEKFAGALGVPVYRFFTDDPVKKPNLSEPGSDREWGNKIADQRKLRRFAKEFKRVSDRNQKLLLAIARKMADRNAKR